MVHKQMSYTISPEDFTKFNSSYESAGPAIFVAWAFHLWIKLRTHETIPPRL